MANGPANSSWHPALMPDTEALPPTSAGAHARTHESSPDAPTRPDEQVVTPEIQSYDAFDREHQEPAEAWFAEEGDAGDADAWLASDHADLDATATNAPPTTQQDGADLWPRENKVPRASAVAKQEAGTAAHENEMLVPAGDQSSQTAEFKERRPQTRNSQHSSSMSFARTVSHEVNFTDDDDSEWNLTRSDADASGFTPPPPQANGAFSAAAPLTVGSERPDDIPLPTSQALDLMGEAERETEVDERRYQIQSAGGSEPPSSLEPTEGWLEQHGPAQAIGGDAQAPEPSDFEARYEEGIPLVSQVGASASTADNGGAVDPFADDNDNNDDFFTQVHGSEPQGGSMSPTKHLLERKSTSQAMGEPSDMPWSPQSTPGDTPSEREAAQTFTDGAQQPLHNVSNPTDPRGGHDNDKAGTEDLASKWQAAFAGDDDDESEFLPDEPTEESKDIDASAFLGSDDEGLLEDDAEDVPAPQPAPTISSGRQSSASNPYTPASAVSRQSSSSYMPASHVPQANYLHQGPAPTPFGQAQPLGQPPPPRPEQSRAQSYADRSKGGYSSPYDLPTDLLSNTVKPRKRASMQQLPRDQPPPPPRSTSMFAPGHPPVGGPAPQGPSPSHKTASSALRNQSNFFEDLPIITKPRPSSRQGNTSQQPGSYTPVGPPQSAPPLATSFPPTAGAASSPGIPGLVAPERVSPYASLQSSAPPAQPSSVVAPKYSPTPSGQSSSQGATPLSAAARYSPAPPGPRPGSSYSSTGPVTPSQTAQPHLPRTSSPLAHFEASSNSLQRLVNLPNGDSHYSDRRANSFEPRLNRVSSLPPTREVEEEEEEDRFPSVNRSVSAVQVNRPANVESKYSSAPNLSTTRQTPPPPRSYAPSAKTSPQRASSNYVPQAAPSAQPVFVPPPRPSTQSPVATQESRQANPAGYSARPSSAHASAAPALPKTIQPAHAPATRRRGQSLSMNMVPPTDGREHDPLERWRGAPLLTWGVGGTVVTTFPKSIPRYTMNQSAPTILRTCGEVKVQNIKVIDPMADRLTKFPGPLKGKSKKKEALAWLVAGIDAQEKELPDISFHSQLSLEAKRGVERLLLWKLLRIFVEHDGALEGSSAVDKAVRDVLSPETAGFAAQGAVSFPTVGAIDGPTGPTTSMMADSADPAAVEQIRLDLLQGNRETAVWSAVDKRLWGHAMLISHTVSPDLYKRVAQEFVRKEVNYPGHNNESIAALYKVLSGNFDDCVDELVPIHARVGLQLVSKESTSASTTDAADGLDKWRETLTLILNNRCSEDVKGLNALGKLLSSYGRAEAAQICFIFGRSLSVFGGLDDQNADFVLLGSDHRQQSDQFAKETEALQLSEVYEYGLSLAGGAAATAGAPHLAAYKLQHAVTLAEYGYRDKALQYCDAIAAAIVSQTRRSPYHHAILEAAVDDFMTRLKQAPRDASSSWMSKPSMNKVSDSMWNRFNKFVSGDDGDNGGNGGSGEADSGPFARVATTPNMSRSPSVSNFEAYGGGSPGYGANPAPAINSAVSSRYAPNAAQPSGTANPYAPVSQYPPAPSSSGRNSSEHPRQSYEPAHPGANSSPVRNSSGYAPTGYSPSGLGFQPVQPDIDRVHDIHPNPVASQPTAAGGYQPLGLQDSPSIYPQAGNNEPSAYIADQGYQPPTHGYEPPQTTLGFENGQMKGEGGETGGYEPPSYQPYSYEPPSYQPDPTPAAEDGEDAPQPKKKSFMDDDEDDIPALRASGKSKTDKDRENEEMFRKAAEEDAKRAAAKPAAKKGGWGFGGWFGGGKKNEAGLGDSAAGKPIRAKLGESSSFVYDPDLKRWVNKKPGAENTEVKQATPPPPRAAPRSASGTPPPAPSSTSTPPPAGDRFSAPPPAGPPRRVSGLATQSSQESLGLGASAMSRSASNPGLAVGPPSGPPSRPATSMSNASSIDDLLGAAVPRKGGAKKPRKSGRYVDVMAK